MAFKRSWNWKDGDWTNDLNHFTLGILPYGVYCGFDADLTVSGMDLNLIHTGSGTDEVDEDLNLTTGIGIVRTKQGVIFKEIDPIVLPISVGDSTNPRIDLIVLQHSYVQVVGGANGTYMIIEGSPAVTPVAPVLPLPNQQVIIGQLLVPAGVTNLNAGGVVYTRNSTPVLANDPTIMRTNVDQHSTAHKKLDFTSTTIQLMEIDIAAHNLVAPADSDFYYASQAIGSYVAGSYILINNITGITIEQGHSAKIVTTFRLQLTSAGNILLGQISDTSSGTLFIEAGETIIITRTDTVNGNPAGSFTVVKAGTANINTITKWFAQQRWNKGGGNGGVTITAGYPQAGYDNTGNYYSFNIANTASLSFMPDTNTAFTGATKEKAGLIVLVQVNTATGGSTWLLNNNAGSPPTGFKPIITPKSADMAMNDGDLVLMIEDVNVWRVISIVGIQSNFSSFLAALNIVEGQVTTLNGQVGGLLTDVATLVSGLAAELAARAAADTVLQTNINTVTANTNTAESVLNSLITAEATTRAGADTSLGTAITNEATRAAAAEAAIGDGWQNAALVIGTTIKPIGGGLLSTYSGDGISWCIIGKTMYVVFLFAISPGGTVPEIQITIPAGKTAKYGGGGTFYCQACDNGVGQMYIPNSGNYISLRQATSTTNFATGVANFTGTATIPIN